MAEIADVVQIYTNCKLDMAEKVMPRVPKEPWNLHA